MELSPIREVRDDGGNINSSDVEMCYEKQVPPTEAGVSKDKLQTVKMKFSLYQEHLKLPKKKLLKVFHPVIFFPQMA